jgi:hypothetical protein
MLSTAGLPLKSGRDVTIDPPGPNTPPETELLREQRNRMVINGEAGSRLVRTQPRRLGSRKAAGELGEARDRSALETRLCVSRSGAARQRPIRKTRQRCLPARSGTI